MANTLEILKEASISKLLCLGSCRVDREVALAISSNVATIALGPVTALLVTIWFSPELQGYYYTFGSLSSLYCLFEFGLGPAIIQFASHEWARLSFDRAGRVIGAAQAISRLTSLTHTALCWYAFLGVILVLLLSVGGFMFFSLGPAYSTEWKWAWFALCGGIGLNFVFLPVFYLLQGCNQVAEFWLYRLWQQILNNVSLGIAIVVGAGLWASPVAAFVSVVWSGCFLWYAYPRFVPSLMVQTLGQQIRWWKEIWPVQWRIAICWPSSYFIVFSFAPILFVVRGPGEAGQMGIMTSISSVLLALSSNWVVTRAPRFGVLVAQKKFSELDRLFINSFIMSCIVATIGAVTIVGCVYLLSRFGHPLASRLLGPIPTAVLLLATVGNLCVSNLSVYLRAFKGEPLVVVYLVSAIAIVLGTYTWGAELGAIGVTAAYLFVIVLFQLPAAMVIFWRFRSRFLNENGSAVSCDTNNLRVKA